MTAICLLVVLVAAKVFMLDGRIVTTSPWMLVALFSRDVLVALVAAALGAVISGPRVMWSLYGLSVLYVAINVPVALVLGSPLTMPMIRAARGPLTDSILHGATPSNLAPAAVVILIGIALPVAWARSGQVRGSRRLASALVAAGAVFVALGPVARARVDPSGLDRNAFTTLVPLALPAVTAAPLAGGDWRASPFSSPRGTDLRQYRGSAHGLNVLVVVLESTAARYLQPYGAAEDPMPHLTALSRRALLFENAYATYPESIKGLFSTLCSRYPAFNESAETHAAAPCASVGEALSAAGYHSGLFHSGRFGYLGMDALIRDKGFEVLEDAGAIGGNVHSSFGVDEPATVSRILAWIDSLASGERFFVTYLPIAGHHPYATPVAGPFPRDGDIGQYRNALHYGDEALAALLAGLRSRQLDDKTLIVVFGDHGEAFGQHPGNVGHTLFVNDENIKVPYLISIPHLTDTVTRVPAVISLLDTAPTILDLVGLPQSPDHQGKSLLDPTPRMALFFTDYSQGWLGLRDGCWKYVLDVQADRSKVFDVCRDPDETQDIAAAVPDRVRAYRTRVEQWSRAQKASLTRVAHH